jgi:two-component system nitrogen regulation response regulator NtrX
VPRKPDEATPPPKSTTEGAPTAPSPIHARLGTPALKSLDPAAARWIATIIRVSSGHPAMTRILDVVERLSDHPYRTNAVLWGEPGTGKGGLGRALAQLMAPERPLIRLDVKGFSTEAALDALCGLGNRPGAAERAHGGFLLVEEIVDLPPQVQEALLRLLKSGRTRRQGTERDLPEKLQVNVIALSDHDVAAAVTAGQVRDDLYWRLARVLLWLPPLRERLDDLSAAAIWMGNRILGDAGIPLNLHTTEDLTRATPAERRRAIELDASAIDALRVHNWPGNFRELEATLERALLLQRRGSRLGAEQIRTALALGRNA